MSKRTAAKDEDRDEPAEPPPRKKQRANHGGPSPPSLKDHLDHFPNHILDNVCSDEHLVKLTDHFHDWLAISTYLGLTVVEQRDIRDSWPHNPQNQRWEMFETWKRKKAKRATYRCLIIALHEAKNANLIDELCKIVTMATSSSITPFRSNVSLSSADNRSITQACRQNEHSLPLTMATAFQRESNSTFLHNVSTSPLSSTHCDSDRQSQRLVPNVPYTHDSQAAGRDSYYSRNFQVQTSPQFAHVPFLVGECFRGVEYRHPSRFSSGGSESDTHALLTNSGGNFAFQQPPSANVANLGGQPPVTVYSSGGLESPIGMTSLHRGIEGHTSLTHRREALEAFGPPADKYMRLDTQQAMPLEHCNPPPSRTNLLLETCNLTDTVAVESQNTSDFEGVNSRQQKIIVSPLEQGRTNDLEGDTYPQQSILTPLTNATPLNTEREMLSSGMNSQLSPNLTQFHRDSQFVRGSHISRGAIPPNGGNQSELGRPQARLPPQVPSGQDPHVGRGDLQSSRATITPHTFIESTPPQDHSREPLPESVGPPAFGAASQPDMKHSEFTDRTLCYPRPSQIPPQTSLHSDSAAIARTIPAALHHTISNESPLQPAMPRSPQPSAKEPLPSTRTHLHQARQLSPQPASEPLPSASTHHLQTRQPSPLLVSVGGNPMACDPILVAALRPANRAQQYLPHHPLLPYHWSNTQQPPVTPSYAPFQSPMMMYMYHQQIAAPPPSQIPHPRLPGDSARRMRPAAQPHATSNESPPQPAARMIPEAQSSPWRNTYHPANSSHDVSRLESSRHKRTDVGPSHVSFAEFRGVEVLHSQPCHLLYSSTSTQDSNTNYEPPISQRSQPNITLSVPCVDNSTMPASVSTSPCHSANSRTRRLSTNPVESPKHRSEKGRKVEIMKGRKRESSKDRKEVSEEERKRACNTAATQGKRARKYHCKTSESTKKTKRFKGRGSRSKAAVHPSTLYTQTTTESSPVIQHYATNVLREKYKTEQWICANNAFCTDVTRWPPVAIKKVFNLAMIKNESVQYGRITDDFVRKTINGNLDDILRVKIPVELENILTLESRATQVRKVILIEGAPGSGKSTLCLDICQKWEAGKLFQEYVAVILVRLRDPLVQEAKSIKDLLPRQTDKEAEEVSSEICVSGGEGILWILDGWDEFPSHLQQDSVIRQLITSKRTVSVQCPLSSVIITSRPISSGKLYPFVTTRIEVLGYTPEIRKQYFEEALGYDKEAVETLQDKIGENPAVESSCYLPLNAAIILYIFLCSGDHSLPNTHYGIFSALVCNSILRHLKERMKQNITEIVSLDHLPEIVQGPFHSLCKLAYRGVMENKLTFSQCDLSMNPENSEINTLGLLQGVESLVSTGKHMYYNFLHLSIQELLAAYHVAKQLSPEEQVSKFQEMFHQARFRAVFRFYAAITKLQTPGINSVITSIIQRKDQELLVSLLNCLYEVQDPSLCKFVSEQLEGKLDLERNSLSSVDCLSVGYFLSSICITTSGVFKVNLNTCSIDQEGCKFLMRGLSRYLDPNTTSTAKLDMNLSRNSLTPVGVTLIAEVIQTNGVFHELNLSTDDQRLSSFKGVKTLLRALQRDTSLVELYLGGRPVKIITEEDRSVLRQLLEKNQTLQVLNLSTWKLYDTGASYIADGLKSNNTLKRLDLSDCDISSSGMESLSLALMENTTLETLDVSDNNIFGDTGAEHLGNALQQNNSLKKLNLTWCDITDKDVESLAKCLTTNKALRELELYWADGISEYGVSCLTKALESNSTLLRLVIPRHLKSSAADMERVVNEARRRRGLPDSSMLKVQVW